jgi:hypothetical protein
MVTFNSISRVRNAGLVVTWRCSILLARENNETWQLSLVQTWNRHYHDVYTRTIRKQSSCWNRTFPFRPTVNWESDFSLFLYLRPNCNPELWITTEQKYLISLWLCDGRQINNLCLVLTGLFYVFSRLCWIKHHARKMCRGKETNNQLHSRRERVRGTHGTHCLCVRSEPARCAVENVKNNLLPPTGNLTPAIQSVTHRYIYPGSIHFISASGNEMRCTTIEAVESLGKTLIVCWGNSYIYICWTNFMWRITNAPMKCWLFEVI